MNIIMPSISLYSVSLGESSLKRSKPARHKNLLLYKTSGTTYYYIGEKRYCISEGDLIYIPDGTAYSVETTIAGGYIAVVFLSNFCDGQPRHKHIAGIGVYFENLLRSFNLADNEILRCYSLMFEILHRLTISKNSDSPAPHNALMSSKAAAFLSNNFRNHNIRITNLYKMAGVSGVYFCRMFKDVYGVTPSNYLAELRLAAAKKLLCEGKSVAETADAVGFYDSLYFSKFFRKHTGISPTEYVSRYRE